jgi:hypothetical protein
MPWSKFGTKFGLKMREFCQNFFFFSIDEINPNDGMIDRIGQ